MKCELCHKNEAQSAITREQDGEEQELYVCNECARKEKASRQARRTRTRKFTGLPGGMEMSITEVSMSGGEDQDSGDGPPPIFKALIDAVHGMVSDFAKADEERKKRKPPEMKKFQMNRSVHPAFRVKGLVHLEGLYLTGELNQVKRAFEDMGLSLEGLECEGMKDIAHLFSVSHPCDEGLAKRAVAALVEQEQFARISLVDELPRVLADTYCRVLATLKNCRLLTAFELLDLLSTLRLAVLDGMVDGITLAEIDALIKDIDLAFPETGMENQERDRLEMELADETNARFENVMLNEKAERILQI